MPAEVEDTFALVGKVVAGRYAVERVVARGGFGLVYKAKHLELDAPVALKVLLIPAHLRGSANAVFVAQFLSEARTLAALKHPAIVRALDAGSLDVAPDHEPSVWMALEWIDGPTLDDDLRARGGHGRSPRACLSLLTSAFEAIATAHARGIAHRDLKPGNLMLSTDEGSAARLRVLDFGVAKAMTPDEQVGSGVTETRSDFTGYSPFYAAPEQVGRLRTGPWTDVHALGLLVTEVLTGQRAYQGEESLALYGAVLSPDRPTPARHGVDVGPWEAVLRKALALRADERYAHAGELLAALSASVDDAQRAWERPVTVAAPAAPARESAPTVSRAPRYVVGLAALLAAFVALAVGARFLRPPSPVTAPRPAQSTTAAPPSPRAGTATAERVVAPSARAPVAPPRPEHDAAARLPPPRARVTPRRRVVGGDADPEVMME